MEDLHSTQRSRLPLWKLTYASAGGAKRQENRQQCRKEFLFIEPPSSLWPSTGEQYSHQSNAGKREQPEKPEYRGEFRHY